MSSSTNLSLTDPTKRIVEQIVPRAFDRGLFFADDVIVMTLALWALIRWERKVGLVVLERMGVDLHRLADELDARLLEFALAHPVVGKGEVVVFEKTGEEVNCDWSTPIDSLLAKSEAEARQLQHNFVDTEHLLLAIIANADADMRRILDKQNISYDRAKAMTVKILGF